MSLRPLGVAVMAVVVVATGTVVAVVELTGATADRLVANTRSVPRETHRVIADFALLHTPASASTTAGIERAKRLLNPPGARPFPGRFDWRATGMTRLRGDVTVWLVPGSVASCTVVIAPGSSNAGCQGDAASAAIGFGGFATSESAQQIIWILPDGSRATLELADGSSLPAPVNSVNAFVVDRSGGDPVRSIKITGNGATSILPVR